MSELVLAEFSTSFLSTHKGVLPSSIVNELKRRFNVFALDPALFPGSVRQDEKSNESLETISACNLTNLISFVNILSSSGWVLCEYIPQAAMDKLICLCAAVKFIFHHVELWSSFLEKEGHTPIETEDYQAAVLQLSAILDLLVEDDLLHTLRGPFVFDVADSLFRKCGSQHLGNGNLETISTEDLVNIGILERKLMGRILEVKPLPHSIDLRGSGVYKAIAEKLEYAAEFVEKDGMLIYQDKMSIELATKSYINRFKRYSDFDLWRRGEGIYLEKIFKYLSQVQVPADCDYDLMHILCGLFYSPLEDKKLSSTSFSEKEMLEKETERLNALQRSVAAFGGLTFVLKCLGRVLEHDFDDYFWNIIPLVMKFAEKLLGWQNKALQDQFIELIDSCIAEKQPPECHCLVGLRKIARKCSSEFESDVLGNGNELKVIKLVNNFFNFISAICQGANATAQLHLSGLGWRSPNTVNVVDEACMVAKSLYSGLAGLITFMSNAHYLDRLAPLVWESFGVERRRFIAWHQPHNDVALVATLLHTINNANRCLMTLCCRHCESSIANALRECMPALEIASLINLTATSTTSEAAGMMGIRSSKRVISWEGGDPLAFYDTYIAEMSRLGLLQLDEESDSIYEAKERWERSLNSNSCLVCSDHHSKSFEQAFTVSQAYLREIAIDTEESFVLIALSFFEESESHDNAALVAESLRLDILLQNVDCAFKRLDGADAAVSRVVHYISLLDTLTMLVPSHAPFLKEWYKSCADEHRNPRDLFGSIEIIKERGTLQRIYFPVPKFILKYWSYPEVQAAKHDILENVVRTSPEEKLASFLEEMKKTIFAMQRQQLLNWSLTPVLHPIFGGKLPLRIPFFPSTRTLTLVIAFCFNIYQVYFHSLNIPFEPNQRNPTGYFQYWVGRDRFLNAVSALEFALYLFLTFRRIINSAAANRFLESISLENPVAHTLALFFSSPVVLLLCTLDALWFVSLSVCAFFAMMNTYWFYVPCLIDIVFQFKEMFFLYEAITKNLVRILYTMLLIFLILYFVTILVFFFVGDEYTFNGTYAGCSQNNTIIGCWLTHLDYGLSNAPEWPHNSYINPVLTYSFPYDTTISVVIGTLFQLLYVIIINLVLQAIISGLIIDTFASMRDEAEFLRQDTLDKCFICSIPREEFEQAGIDFLVHIKEEHNMWHYVWYKIYLDVKDPLTFTINEKYAVASYKDARVRFNHQSFKRILSYYSDLFL